MTRQLRTPRLLACGSLAFALTTLAATEHAAAQVATALVRERGVVAGLPAGHIVNSINNTATNHVGGYAVNINTSDGATTLSHIWGNAAGGAGTVMRSEGTFGSLTQTAYESFYGIANDGSVAYSATGTGGPVGGFDSVWLDDTPIAVEGNPVPSIPGQFYVFASRPGITADGKPYWCSGFGAVQGGSTQNRALFFTAGASVLLQGGSAVPGLPFPLTTAMSFDYRMSELGSHYIIPMVMSSGSTLHDDVMVMDNAGLMAGGSLVREQTPVPAASGGLPGENWDNFDHCGANEAGDWYLTGDTEPSTINDEIIVKNGVIVYREGQVVDGEILSGDVEHAYMNADGDIAYIWDIQANTLETLFVNDQLLVKETDLVDLTGDGVADANKRLANFTGISSLTMSDRDVNGFVDIYFTADIDTANTTTTADDVEGFFRVHAFVDSPVAVALENFEVTSDASGRVALAWATSRELDHRGFHVYRGSDEQGPFERLTSALVTGGSPYTYIDATAQVGDTYTYRLGAVDGAGREQMMGRVSITAGSSMRTALLPNSPNPFVGSTELRFALARNEPARVAIYDARGRLVRLLASGSRSAGMHSLRWDGRDARGLAVAGGAYYCKLESSSGTQTIKVLRLPGE